jgi:predicted MFS family arabinose efflux permease
MGSSIWIGIFVGSTIGGLIPEIWGGDMLSYSGVLLSGAGALVGCGSGRERQDDPGFGLRSPSGCEKVRCVYRKPYTS